MTEPSDEPSPPDNVVSLSQHRAWLGRSRRARRADELLAGTNPERAIRALPGDELYYALVERGLPEASELLIYASGPQVQTVLDFAAWDRDRLDDARLRPWLTALMEAPDERITEWVRDLDVELVALIFRRGARVWNLQDGEPPDSDEGRLVSTPDGFFAIELLGNEDQQQLTHRLLDAIYRTDLEYARRLLVSLQGELDSELEETAYRWRSGRMADLGFVDFYEALEAFRELDPTTVQIGEATPGRQRPVLDGGDESSLRLPTPFAAELGDASRFARALGRVTDKSELAELHAALVALCNRVLAAERIDPAEAEAVEASLSRVRATLDLAVDHLGRTPDGRSDEDRERDAVRTVPLLRLHRLGVSLIGKAQRLASALLNEHPFAASGFTPIDAEERAVLEGLAQRRPVLVEPGGAERPLSSLLDLARARAVLERAAAGFALLAALGVRPEDLRPERWPALGLQGSAAPGAEIDAGLLARTALLASEAGLPAPPPVAALPSLAVRALEKRLASAAEGELPPLLRAAEARLDEVQRAVPAALRAAAAVVATRWLQSLHPLQPVLTTSP